MFNISQQKMASQGNHKIVEVILEVISEEILKEKIIVGINICTINSQH
jgi:hypothetical protein